MLREVIVLRSSKEIIDYLNKLRQEQDMSISELARQVGMAKSGVSRYFNHTREFPINRAPEFAKALHVKVEDILGVESFEKDKSPSNAVEIDQSKVKCIPLIGTIAMGTPITADQNIERYIPEYFIENYDASELFALKCQGHSMEPSIPDSAIAIIHEQPDVEDDEIAAVLMSDSNEATLKRIKHMGNSLLLMPDNKSYDPILLDKSHPGKILGKLVKYEVMTR